LTKSKNRLKHLVIQNYLNADKYTNGKILSLRLIENEPYQISLKLQEKLVALKIQIEF